MDRKITIQRASITHDAAFNEPRETWHNLYPNLWANKRSKSGKEVFSADQEIATEVMVFTIRYKPVLVTDRIVYEGRIYDILPPLNELGRRRYLEITASWSGETEEIPEGAIVLENGAYIVTEG
ncbi:SPP1 family predicted phage head-tail adaptor [Pontibacter ummariensis]|uniref:Phage head-tail adaptor, putative, SPP1 family n=2 Tax=Pontibacter ummariensis TaxID=1610492 RepID=A0A239HJ55_9BACT|nr:phage head closure protein [Pontibacter ummariensis]PRY10287.1 SPP1 family predicted phage head-tail adaptor [Pontibacter ummariensis]SNS81456.1 phage head-tail adaptor, putative, SPP1 family [Pontibacter ummariensis]